jgi:hypothetical protein
MDELIAMEDGEIPQRALNFLANKQKWSGNA